MIVTVTPNPSLDRTLEVTSLDRGAVHRADRTRVEAGGKGINVARALHAHRLDVQAVLPCGGLEGQALVALLAAEGITPVLVQISGAIRANVSLVEPDGEVTKVNEPGPVLTRAEVESLLRCSADLAAGASWVVGSGSLPPGAPTDLFAELTRRAHDAGARVAIDTSGPPLSAALDARPDLVKPNLEELEEVTGRTIRNLADAAAAAASLRDRGAHTVLASLGADGVLLVDDHGILHGRLAVARPRSTVGAGDATLAGYLSAASADRSTAVRRAVAFGAAAVALAGSQMPGPDDVQPDLVEITALPSQPVPSPP
jgi:1-phosphofructokinase